MRSRATLPLYIGGFLGPFGGGVVAVLVPQLRDAFDATTAGVAATMPAYLVPYAVLQLVSGTIGERFGRRRVVRAGYVAYTIFMAAAAFAPSLGVFIVLRALQGCANAFLTPLLLAGLADEVPPRQIGRAVGTFAAVQTAAVALSPLCGGLLGALDWRLVFVAPAIVAAALALLPPSDGRPREHVARLRAVVTRRVGLLSAAGFAAYAGITGLGFLVAVRAADEFGVDSIARGALLAGFGVSGMVFGRAAGDAVDRFGRTPVVLAGATASAALVALLGIAPTAGALAALWFVTGVGSALVWAGINVLAVEAVPGNRAGGTSVVSAFKFAGNAAAPVMWLPLYHIDPWIGFLGAAVLAALTGALVAPLRMAR
ncbi:MAG TPA: MFS transporter [Solirubrobacter sp.]|nr:MFS transporter [Solirubrobacter sp.]